MGSRGSWGSRGGRGGGGIGVAGDLYSQSKQIRSIQNRI